jgi:hypothetical protein
MENYHNAVGDNKDKPLINPNRPIGKPLNPQLNLPKTTIPLMPTTTTVSVTPKGLTPAQKERINNITGIQFGIGVVGSRFLLKTKY